jgi:hypothetical protein
LFAEPLERDLPLEAPLLELRALLAAFGLAFLDFAFVAFGLDAFELDTFGFDDFVDFGFDDFVDFGLDDFDVDFGFDVDRFFGLVFVSAIVPLSSELVPSFRSRDWFQWIGYPIHCREISMDG